MRRESELNWEKLIYELEKHLKDHPQIPIENGKENKTTQQEIHSGTKGPEFSPKPQIYHESAERREKEELPFISPSSGRNHLANSISNILNQVKENRVLLYRSRGHFHGRLHEARTNEIRRQLAEDIIKIQSDIEAVNKDLRLIQEGNIPRELVLKMMTADQYKDYRNYQNYVVRYRNYLKRENLSEEKRSGYEAKLQEYQSKIENFFAYV